jgi:hypothetical protein
VRKKQLEGRKKTLGEEDDGDGGTWPTRASMGVLRGSLAQKASNRGTEIAPHTCGTLHWAGPSSGFLVLVFCGFGFVVFLCGFLSLHWFL